MCANFPLVVVCLRPINFLKAKSRVSTQLLQREEGIFCIGLLLPQLRLYLSCSLYFCGRIARVSLYYIVGFCVSGSRRKLVVVIRVIKTSQTFAGTAPQSKCLHYTTQDWLRFLLLEAIFPWLLLGRVSGRVVKLG
jgi:hypothetical protein